jgi:hypothetical protein
MERLQRTTPPPADAACRAWVDVSNDPTKPPVIRDAQHLRVLKAEKDRMIEASEARLDDCVPSVKPAKKDETTDVFFDVMLRLENRPALGKPLKLIALFLGPNGRSAKSPAAVPSRSTSDYSKSRNVFYNPGAMNPLNWYGVSGWRDGAAMKSQSTSR